MLTRTLGIVTLIVTSFVSGTARADAHEVAARCIAAIHEARQGAVQHIHAATQSGVERIEHLDANGASNQMLVRSARASTLRIDTIAHSSGAHIARLVRECVRELEGLDAPEALIHAVREAGRDARQRIGTAAENGQRVIHRALHDALD